MKLLKYIRNISLLILLPVIAMPQYSMAQPVGNDTTYTITKARIWLDGTTNINRYSCNTNDADGMVGQNEALQRVDRILNVDYTPSSDNMDSNSIQGWLKVSVKSLGCGNKHMNKDVYHSLKSDSFPDIFFALQSSRLIKPGLTEKDPFKVETKGLLTIAGRTREVNVTARGYRLKTGCFRVQGSEPILMSDYDIDPPSPFFGIVKAKDKITVHFDLIATPVSVTYFASRADTKPECNAGVNLTQ